MSIYVFNRTLNKNNKSSPSVGINKSRSTKLARTRITRACDHCQQRRTKCDSAKPRCSQCVKRNDTSCTFTARINKRGPKPKQYINYYSTYSNEKQPQKSTDTYPYISYFPLNTQSSDLRNNTNVKTRLQFNCNQQSSTLKNSNLTLNYSEFPTSATCYDNSRKIPFINQSGSSSSPSLPSLQRFRTNISTSRLLCNRSLRLQSVSNTRNLPPIKMLLSINDIFQNRRDLIKPVISSPSYYKLNNPR